MKTAICQVADTGPLESLAVMLTSAGYQCHIPSTNLKAELRRIGCDTVIDIDRCVASKAYEEPFHLPIASERDMATADLYVDVKAHRNGPKVWERWPNLENKTLWYRINGGEPTHAYKPSGESQGDEINLNCPILTPNLWYKTQGPWSDRAYAMWPPFVRFDDYYPKWGRAALGYTPPVCLVHNFRGWGYHVMQDEMQGLGVKIYGEGSPDGVFPHKQLPHMLSTALAYVHLKSNDAPGYALYEALSAGCPCIVSRRLIIKNLMQDLFVDGVTCLVYDWMDDESKVHHQHTPADVARCYEDVKAHLNRLRDPLENQRIGNAGREQLRSLMWNESQDGPGFREFMGKHFK